MTEPDLEQIKQPRNHWNDDGDLVIEQKTLFRHVGYLGHSGTWYPNNGTWPTASQWEHKELAPYAATVLATDVASLSDLNLADLNVLITKLTEEAQE